MKKQIEQVKAFHQAFKVPYRTTPGIPSIERVRLRDALILEETEELSSARNPTDALDGIVDSLYVLIGTAHEYGLAHLLEDAFDEIHRSNMSKLDENLYPIYNEMGKVMKGPNYREPNLKRLFVEQPELGLK